jgi:cyclohexyl-isocyanide hydratase
MDDEPILSFIRKQMESGRYVFSVCTGALLCGAAGILQGRRATSHRSTFDLLHYFGAKPTNARVVVDGNLVSAAGVTAGIDGALTMAALLCGEQTAQEIQLSIEYAPEPPYTSGTPASARREVLEAVLDRGKQMKDARTATARRIANRLGIG